MAETEKSQDDAASKQSNVPRRKRGTGFPVVSLAEAASILKEAGKYGFEHSTPVFASYMGHSSTNSGAFRQRLAAFRDWKLIAGHGDSLSMTEVARKIAIPTDDETETRALREAFMNSAAFAKLYDDLGKDQPLSRSNLGSKAVHELGVAPGSQEKFVESFVRSAVTASLGELSDDDLLILRSVSDEESAVVEAPPAGLRDRATTRGSGVRPTSGMQRGDPVVHQVWGIDSGSILFEIRTERPLQADAFAKVGEVVASLENLAETLVGRTPTGADASGEKEA